jgi:hypothetical protein
MLTIRFGNEYRTEMSRIGKSCIVNAQYNFSLLYVGAELGFLIGSMSDCLSFLFKFETKKKQDSYSNESLTFISDCLTSLTSCTLTYYLPTSMALQPFGP